MVHKAFWRSQKRFVPVPLWQQSIPGRRDASYDDDKHAWKSLRDEAGVQCRLHDLRHTAIKKMAEAGVPESTMLALAGHMSRAMLERYSHVRLNAKRDAVEALNLPQYSPAVPAKVPAQKNNTLLQ